MSDSLRPHRLQHNRLPCPSPSPVACSNSSPLNWWCHPIVLSGIVPFSSCLQSFPASASCIMNYLFASAGQRIGASASASVLPVEFLSDWLVWSLCSPKVSQESSPILQLKTSLLQCSAIFMAQLSHRYITIALTRRTFVGKVMSLLFNMLSRLVIAFLPRSKHHLISWLQSPSAVGSLVPCRIPWGGTRTLSKATLLFLNCSSLFFFCIPSLPWLETVWICPLESWESHGSWMKSISCKQEMGDTEWICTSRGPKES